MAVVSVEEWIDLKWVLATSWVKENYLYIYYINYDYLYCISPLLYCVSLKAYLQKQSFSHGSIMTISQNHSSALVSSGI